MIITDECEVCECYTEHGFLFVEFEDENGKLFFFYVRGDVCSESFYLPLGVAGVGIVE